MKKGFTLLELIIVIIIIGVLATLGFVQYQSVIERARTGEARMNLGTLRQLQLATFEDTGSYSDTTLGTQLPAACLGQDTHYFSYACVSNGGVCTATRCANGGKAPPGTACTVTLTPAGARGGTCS